MAVKICDCKCKCSECVHGKPDEYYKVVCTATPDSLGNVHAEKREEA